MCMHPSTIAVHCSRDHHRKHPLNHINAWPIQWTIQFCWTNQVIHTPILQPWTKPIRLWTITFVECIVAVLKRMNTKSTTTRTAEKQRMERVKVWTSPTHTSNQKWWSPRWAILATCPIHHCIWALIHNLVRQTLSWCTRLWPIRIVGHFAVAVPIVEWFACWPDRVIVISIFAVKWRVRSNVKCKVFTTSVYDDHPSQRFLV